MKKVSDLFGFGTFLLAVYILLNMILGIKHWIISFIGVGGVVFIIFTQLYYLYYKWFKR